MARATAGAFDRAFHDPRTGGYGENNQAANAIALYLDLVPDERKERVVANLVADVARHGHHLTTGNIATKYLLEVLTEHGHAQDAYRVATQESYPSWGFMLANGATTLWERWEHLTGGDMNSHNHPMMGSVGSWLYRHLAGLQPDPRAPGWRRFVVRPQVIDRLGWVRASYTSPYGRIETSWRIQGPRLALRVTVPIGSTATVHVPAARAAVTEGGRPAERSPGVRFVGTDDGRAVYELQSGAYELAARR
jgi:alpha-L-rhamnosidase